MSYQIGQLPIRAHSVSSLLNQGEGKKKKKKKNNDVPDCPS